MAAQKAAAKKVLNKVEQKASPKDTLDALKLVHENKLVNSKSPEAVQQHAQQLAVAYILHKRAGNIEDGTSFLDWFENGNVVDLVDNDDENDDEADEDANPTQ